MNERRSLAWPGSTKPMPEEDIFCVVNELEPQSRWRLRQLSEAFGMDEVCTLIWLLEASFQTQEEKGTWQDLSYETMRTIKQLLEQEGRAVPRGTS